MLLTTMPLGSQLDPISLPVQHRNSPAPDPPWGGSTGAPAPASAHTHIPVPISVHTLVPFPSRPFAHTYLCAWHQNLTPASPSHPVGCLVQLVAARPSPGLPVALLWHKRAHASP